MFNRAIAYDKINCTSQAIRDYDRAEKVKPDFGLVNFNRGLIYDKLNEFDSALKDFTSSINKTKEPKAEFYLLRGLIHKKKSEYKLALDDFTKVLDINPNNVKVGN